MKKIEQNRTLIFGVVLLVGSLALLPTKSASAQSRSTEENQAFAKQVQTLLTELEPLIKSGTQFRPAGGKKFADKNDFLMLGTNIELKSKALKSPQKISFTFYRYDAANTSQKSVDSLISKVAESAQPSKAFPLNEKLEGSGDLKLGEKSYYLGRKSSTNRESRNPIYQHVAVAQYGRWVFQLDSNTFDAEQSAEIKSIEVEILKLLVEASKKLN